MNTPQNITELQAQKDRRFFYLKSIGGGLASLGFLSAIWGLIVIYRVDVDRPGGESGKSGNGTHNSIVKVQGGSIHGVAPGLQRWQEISPKKLYSATSTDNQLVSTDGFDTNLHSVRIPGTWRITFSNSDQAGTEKTTALQMCPDQLCSLGAVAPGGLIYLSVPRGDVELERPEIYLRTRLHFHDQTPDCDNHTSNESPLCDHIVRMTLERPPAPLTYYTCVGTASNRNACWVKIGQ